MIWIIIPAYNEGRNLRAVVAGIAATLRGQSYQVVIVNDGSTDDTKTVADELAQEYPVRLLRHKKNRGVAEAFRTGITYVAARTAGDDAIVIMEGDGTSSSGVLQEMIRRIQAGADLVIASRYRRGGGYRRFPLKRLILSWGANVVFQVLFPIGSVRDYSIFYRAYRARVLQQALARWREQLITVQTFFANIEILLKIRPYLERVEEVPMVYDYGKKQGKSGMKVWKNLRSYLYFIARHAFRRIPT